MTADPPGRAPNPAVWATPAVLSGWWDLWTAVHEHDGSYRERCHGSVANADQALAWLTDHRRRNPR